MLCRIEMPTNEQIYGRFYRWKLMNQGGIAGMFGVFGLPILAILGALVGWGMGLSQMLLLGIVVAAVGYTVFLLYIKPNMEFRKKEGVALQTEVYIFTETSFTRSVRSEESGMHDNTSGQYNVIQSAVETKTDFFLFTSRSQAYLLDKEYFTKGTPADMRKTLQEKLGDKFKTKEK